MGAVVVAALTIAPIVSNQEYLHGVFQTAVLLTFLATLLHTIYAGPRRSAFAGGWAICTGVMLTLVYMRLPILALYIEHAARRAYPRADFNVRNIDMAFTVITAYLGGTYASYLQRRRTLPEKSSDSKAHCG